MAMNAEFLMKLRMVLERDANITAQISETKQQLQSMGGTAQVTGSQIRKALGETGQLAGQGASKSNDFVNALRRAVIVAPIWMAARSAMQFFTQGMQDGIKYLVDFETAAFKLEQTLKAIGTTTNMGALKEEFVKLSQDTGKTTALIATGYMEIIKAGINVKDAMALTAAAVKLQDVTFSESAEVIKAVALGYKFYGDTLDKNLTTEQKATQISADLYQASLKNMVGIDELSAEFSGSAAALHSLGLTMEQSIGLLATLNSEGVKNVTGLKTALYRTFTDTANVAREFGIAIKPDTKPFEIFLALLEKLQSASKTGNIQGLGQALGEIFGKGGRGGTANVKILADALDSLKESLSSSFDTNAVKDFNSALGEVDKTLPQQIQLWDNYRKQAFEAFVIGVTGGKDFANSLEKINDFLKNTMIPNLSKLGEAIHLTFAGGGNPLLMALIATTEAETRASQESYNRNTLKLKGITDAREAQKKLTAATIETSQAETVLNTKASIKSDKLIMQQQLNILKESGLLTEVQLLEYEKEQIKNAGTLFSVEERKLKLKELDAKMATAYLKDSENLIKHELELFKIRGASESQLFKIETALKMQLMGIDAVKNSTLYQLELEKQLTKEKMNQLQVGNDSVALMNLAKKYGTDAAKEVGKVLMNPDQYRTFDERTGSEAAKKGFAEFFASKQENFEAQKFFGIGQYKGAYIYGEGRNIPIPERDLVGEAKQNIDYRRGKYLPFDESNLAGVPRLSDLQKQFGIKPNIETSTSRPVTIQSLEVNVVSTKDKEKMSEQIQIDIADAIRTDPKVRQALDEKISEF